MPSPYEYLTLILLLRTCAATTLITDSPSKIPTPLYPHKNILKHRAPPPDSVFDYSTLRVCEDRTVSSSFLNT